MADNLSGDWRSRYEAAKAKVRSEQLIITPEQRTRIIDEFRKQFTPETPMMDFEGLQVMLMEAPQKMEPKELASKNILIKMFYVGSFVSCFFQSKDQSMQVFPGNEYLIVGKYREKTQEEGDFKGNVNRTMNVRAVIPFTEVTGGA